MTARRLIAPVLVLAAGCVEVQQVAPPSGQLLAALRSVAPLPTEAQASSAPVAPFTGIEVEEVLAGSLDDLAASFGLQVVGVAQGSPAEAAGVRLGDRVVGVEGRELAGLDAWQAELERAAGRGSIRLALERNLGVIDVDVALVRRENAALLEPARFVERLKARVELDTRVADTPDGERPVARVVRLLPESPLAAAGLGPGALIAELDGAPMEGGATLALRLSERDYGERIAIGVLESGALSEVEVELWSPPRELTGLGVPILFHWHRDRAADRTDFALIDLWLIALYDYRRVGTAVRHRVLRFFEFASGGGELVEVEAEREDER